jgi:hypothetical protein
MDITVEDAKARSRSRCASISIAPDQEMIDPSVTRTSSSRRRIQSTKATAPAGQQEVPFLSCPHGPYEVELRSVRAGWAKFRARHGRAATSR